MTDRLSEFQRVMAARVRRVLDRARQPSDARVVEGQHERYLQWDLPAASLFVYVDEAGIQGPGLDRRFEREAFASPDELRDAFLAAVVELLLRLAQADGLSSEPGTVAPPTPHDQAAPADSPTPPLRRR